MPGVSLTDATPEMFWADIPSLLSHLEGDREFADSLLEEAGFEPSVPRPQVELGASGGARPTMPRPRPPRQPTSP
jgi:hypothetical protein